MVKKKKKIPNFDLVYDCEKKTKLSQCCIETIGNKDNISYWNDYLTKFRARLENVSRIISEYRKLRMYFIMIPRDQSFWDTYSKCDHATKFLSFIVILHMDLMKIVAKSIVFIRPLIYSMLALSIWMLLSLGYYILPYILTLILIYIFATPFFLTN